MMTADRTLELARAYTTYGDVLYGEGLYAGAADWYRRAEALRQGAVGPRGRAAGPSAGMRESPSRAWPS
jgi:hypothetical protein